MGPSPSARCSSPRIKSRAWPVCPPPPHTGLPVTPSHQSESGALFGGGGDVRGGFAVLNPPPTHTAPLMEAPR